MISRSVIPTLSFILLAMAVTHGDRSVVAAPLSEPGLKELKFITESKYIEPGSTITVGLRIVPDEGHHTYWRGPGIVGVATVIEWDLPEGFEAGPIQWPAPEKVDMVGITANGYKGDTILLTEIKIPEDLPRGAFHLHAKIAWMSCATSCNPGVTKRTIGFLHDPDEKPQTRSAMKLLFDSVRKEMPEPAPEEWVHTVSLPDKETIKLKVSVPGIDRSWAKGLEFFCDDMQVDSNEATFIQWPNKDTGAFTMQFSRPGFAPGSPEKFSGVLKSSKPWPGTKSRFVEISIPWPEGTFRDG